MLMPRWPYPATDNNKVSCKFPFQQHTIFYDHEIDIKFHMCMRRECMFRDKPTVLFHGHCYAFRVHLVTPKFLAATQYAFAPSVAEERRRADYIQKALALDLQRALVWPRSLPHELWLMVAESLAQACASLTAQEQVQGSVDVDDSTLDLRQPVYASYVKIDGRCYVKSLQNTPGVSGGKGTYLLQPAQAPKEESNNMFVAEDHLGICQVVFVSPRSCLEWCRNHPAVLGTWWRHISYKAIPSAVVFRSDYPGGLRMRFCDLNTADVVGYSVATDGAKVLAILSHKQNDQPDTALYEDVSAEICHWMYMPMNEGEYLTDICRRAGCSIIQTQVVGITVMETLPSPLGFS
ncbi:hypothetical protein CH063_00354 [Colletotrichum higginsianum]|uniref:Uncharacterized protein n=1 Tax=Colletotrichum higginsianum (strain IMI 349063) TaxID=759273 RepID=H1VJV7_COLHI|nr:hypothetical protein CH63R_06709 [Colletotrichum higginsianum IMI 349063]OBR11017.1 hypothetical protein CH63R_06709 [Colletotrichum higginsianum IMI 349063]CCF40510.1 hypothetical protein CH063_00354 [Colletotrichum higginsianum]